MKMRILVDEIFNVTSNEAISFMREKSIRYTKSLQEKYLDNYDELLKEYDIIITNATDIIELRDKRKSELIIIKLDDDLTKAHLESVIKVQNNLKKGETYSLMQLQKNNQIKVIKRFQTPILRRK